MEKVEVEKLAIHGGTPIRESFLPFGAPKIGEEEIAEVVDTLRSGWIGTGPKTQEFETRFAEYVGARYAVAVNSCTAGLHLSLIVAGVGPGDEVITSPLTFAATANVIEHCGARPVFVDVNPEILNLDPAGLEEAITENTRAILPVHFGGLPCEMEPIMALAETHGLIVIEDAAHAAGARYRGRMVGTIGRMTSFSFYPNKNLTTIEGGMITSDDEADDEWLRVYRLHGMSRDAWMRYRTKRLSLTNSVVPGFKYNLTDVQASLGLHQLAKLETFLEVRETYAAEYDAAFGDLRGVRLQPRQADEGTRHALHLYVLLLDPDCFTATRNEILDALLAENIGAALHYRALHTHPYYQQKYGYQPSDYPHAYRAGESILSLPLMPAMTPEDVTDVIRAVHKVLSAFAL